MTVVVVQPIKTPFVMMPVTSSAISAFSADCNNSFGSGKGACCSINCICWPITAVIDFISCPIRCCIHVKKNKMKSCENKKMCICFEEHICGCM